MRDFGGFDRVTNVIAIVLGIDDEPAFGIQERGVREAIGSAIFFEERGARMILVGASEEGEFCIVLSYLPQRCPQDRRWQCAELLTRINYGMALGGFQMELETGKVLYNTSYPFKAGNFEKDLFWDLLKQNFDVMDHFMPAIGWVVL